ncbi:MAG: cyclic nucleotide-binding domain-containing protein [Pseudomonadota bacterium]
MKRSEKKVDQLRMPSSRSPLSLLRDDVVSLGVDLTGSEWEEFASVCIETSYEKRETIFQDGVGPEYLLFIADGVCAGQATQPDGQTVVARFFEPRDFCAKIRFTRRGYTSTNTIVATTPVEGVLIPMDRWREEHLEGERIGKYARQKMMMAHHFDIDIIQVKTLNRTVESYEFLREHQPGVLRSVPQRVIAQFLGITPEGLSRFLKANPQYID